MRGRKPLPANVHRINGNPSKLSTSELRGSPNAPVAIPAPPAHLAGEAMAEWHRITAELVRLGLVSQIDMVALALYCSAWGEFAHAQQHIAELNGELIVRHPNGFQGPSPWLAIRDKAAERCRRMLTEFGLSPSSRSRVKAASQGELFGDGSPAGEYFDG